ncbi:DUF4386 family protein [Candidatus Bipolaricaulota bacterium]|nr:DUF4386 family protein [Candidatus Bipolaricaulota bacterium]
MNSNRKAAILTGVFFIVGTIAGMISLGVFTDPILGASDVLVSVSANEGKVIVGVLLELVMAVALAGMAIAVYPVLKSAVRASPLDTSAPESWRLGSSS